MSLAAEDPAQTTQRSAEIVTKLAYDEGIRTLKHQDAEVDTIRSQVRTLAAVAGISTSIAAGGSLSADGVGTGVIVVGLAATGLLIWLLLELSRVLRPIEHFYVEVEPKYIIERCADQGLTPEQTYRKLCEHIQNYQAKNHEKLLRLRRALHRAQIAAILQVLAWALLTWVAIA